MALVSTPGGLFYPLGAVLPLFGDLTNTAFATLNAATDKAAFEGRVYIEGRASSKTISAAGGGSISFQTTTVIFADGATSVLVGLQDISNTTGRPDAAFDVQSAALVGGGGAIASDAWNTITMTGGSGSKTLSHGDLVSVVIDMTARGSTDAISITGGQHGAGILFSQLPITWLFDSGIWNNVTAIPNTLITFDDGTYGIFDAAFPLLDPVTLSSTTIEYGLLFQVPWDCKVDAFFARFGTVTNGPATLNLYSAPITVSPTLLSSVAIDNNTVAVATTIEPFTQVMTGEVSLLANTDYAVTLMPTGAAAPSIQARVLPDEDLRVFLPGSTTLAQVTRTGGSGTFTAQSPAVNIPLLAVRISALTG